MAYLKYAWLIIVKFARKTLRKLPAVFSYFFLVFSVATCFVTLFPNFFYRVPVLSYYINEHELPITYELSGEVKVIDKKGNIINKNVEIYVGGYSTSLVSTDFMLKFSSPMTNEVFVVIRYEVDGDVREFTKCLLINDENHVINEVFIIHA